MCDTVESLQLPCVATGMRTKLGSSFGKEASTNVIVTPTCSSHTLLLLFYGDKHTKLPLELMSPDWYFILAIFGVPVPPYLDCN